MANLKQVLKAVTPETLQVLVTACRQEAKKRGAAFLPELAALLEEQAPLRGILRNLLASGTFPLRARGLMGNGEKAPAWMITKAEAEILLDTAETTYCALLDLVTNLEARPTLVKDPLSFRLSEVLENLQGKSIGECQSLLWAGTTAETRKAIIHGGK